MSDDDPYRDPREGQRIHEERRREEHEERSQFAGAVRPRLSPLRLALALLVVSCAVGVVVNRLRKTDPMASPALAPPVVSARLAPLACVQLAADYHVALDKARLCTRDEDCVAERRGQLMTGLDGCARFAVPSKDLLVADDRAQRWQGGGCAGDYRLCGAPRPAICEAHLCAEKPPESVPRSWRRLALPGVFTFFAPADVVDIGLGDLLPDDSWVTRFGNNRFELSFDVQGFRTVSEAEPEGGIPQSTDGRIVRGEEILLGGSRARLDLTVPFDGAAGGPFNISVWAPHVPSQVARGNMYSARGAVAVGIRSRCATSKDCDELMKVLLSFEAW